MKKALLFAGLFSLLLVVPGWSQKTLPGINYQAVARDASGNALPNLPFKVKVALTSENIADGEYFSETHEVLTDPEGFFSLIIGQGTILSGEWSKVPWAEERIWLDVEMINKINPQWKVDGHAQLFSVPYAQHAASAARFSNRKELEPRNQSIYWNTAGNSETRPPVHFLGTRDNRDMHIKTDSTTRAIFTKNGQLQIISGVSGPDNDVASYPVYIEGSTQGIYIKVLGSRTSANNFMTFADPNGRWGRIEGQTLDELLSSTPYIIQSALYVAEGVRLAAEIVNTIGKTAAYIGAGTGAAASLIFAFAAAGFYLAAGGVAAQGVVVGIESAALGVNATNWANNLKDNIGVSFSSGAGDYAEYLPRLTAERDMLPGEIVRVHGGKISLITEGPGRLMVVSTRPAFLGNTPTEEAEKHFEMVAFLGQVPARVQGPVAIGDYILPSGNHDGHAIAVDPSEIKMEDFPKLIGVAWEAVEEEGLQRVLIGVGLNENDLAPKVEEIENKIDNIVAYLEGKGPLRPEQDNLSARSNTGKVISEAAFDSMIQGKEGAIRALYADVAQQLAEKGIGIDHIPGLEKFLADPIQGLKDLRENPAFATQWAQLDRYIMAQQKRK